MSNLSETVKTRVAPADREALEELAGRMRITPAGLLRIFLLEGLQRERERGGESRRV